MNFLLKREIRDEKNKETLTDRQRDDKEIESQRDRDRHAEEQR